MSNILCETNIICKHKPNLNRIICLNKLAVNIKTITKTNCQYNTSSENPQKNMSKNQTLEVNVYQKNENIKLSTQTICFQDDKTLSSLLDELHRQKEVTNDFLTTLVEKNRTTVGNHESVQANSKRKVDDNNEKTEGLYYFANCFYVFK